MECYFGSYERQNEGPGGNKSLVCFSIPSRGICFKAPFAGADELHTDYASLLTLLEFIELNPNYFDDHEIQIYGHNQDMIKQINDNHTSRYEFTELLKKAIEYKEKFDYRLGWVAPDDNPSVNYLYD